jgi:hypothetical protein
VLPGKGCGGASANWHGHRESDTVRRVRWFQTAEGALLTTGIFCFLAGVAAATAGSNTILGLASIALLAAGAVTVTWGAILAFRRRSRAAPGGPSDADRP